MHWNARSCLLVCIFNLAGTDLLSVLASNYVNQEDTGKDEHVHRQGVGNFETVYSDVGTSNMRNARHDLNGKQEVRDVPGHADTDSDGGGPVMKHEEPVEGQRFRRSVINPGLLFSKYGRVVMEQGGEVFPHRRKRMGYNARQRRELYADEVSAAEHENARDRVEHKRSILNKFGRGTHEMKIASSATRKRRNVVDSNNQHRAGASHDSEAENEKPFWKVRFGREETIGPQWTGRFGRELRDKGPLWKSRYGRDGREVAPPWASRYGRDAQEKSLIRYDREAHDKSPFWKGRYGREGHETPFWNGRYGRENANEKPPWAYRIGRDAEESKGLVREAAPHIWKSRFGRDSKDRREQVANQKRLEAAINMELMAEENHAEGGHEQHLARNGKNGEEQELQSEGTQPSVRFGRAVDSADAEDVDRDGSRMKRGWRGRYGRVIPRIVNYIVQPQRSHSAGKELMHYRPIMHAEPNGAIRYGEVSTQRYDSKIENWPAQSRSQGEGSERADASRDTALEENDSAGTGFDDVDNAASTNDPQAEDMYGNRFVYQMELLRKKIRDTETREALATTREGTGYSRGKGDRGTLAGRRRSKNLNWERAIRSELEMIENILHGKIHRRNYEHVENADDYYEQIKENGL